MFGQPLDVVEEDEGREVDLEPRLGFRRSDQPFELLEDPRPQGAQDLFDNNLVQLRVHDRRDQHLPVVRAVGITNRRDPKPLSATYLPRDLDHPGDSPEIERVGNQRVLQWLVSDQGFDSLYTHRSLRCILDGHRHGQPAQIGFGAEGFEVRPFRQLNILNEVVVDCIKICQAIVRHP